MSDRTILIIIALILAVLSIINPAWPFVAVAVLLICVYFLVVK